MAKVIIPDIHFYTVKEFDNYIQQNWKYFNNGKDGYSNNVKIGSDNHPYSNTKINTMHNCKGLADGLFCCFQKATKAEYAARPTGDPYEYYYAIKSGKYDRNWPAAGVANWPVLGAQAVYGKKSPNSKTHYSHIGVVVGIDKDYIWLAEDNLNTVRSDYIGGGKSRNGIRKVKREAPMGSNYPFIGYVHPKRTCVLFVKYHNVARLNIREDASTASKSIRVLALNETLAWYGESKTDSSGSVWFKVNANGTQGWVNTNYIREDA